MAEKKITRKVISKAPSEEVAKEEAINVSKTEEAGRPKRVCFFCNGKTSPSYTDINTLRRFTTDRAKIVARAKSNLCSSHQRAVTRQIKYARHLALLPFVPKV
ncbi:30S ribosomal protein S18 [Candidatus Daviesbacteria bacterium]|nr:30S ribosomal protein S18 [Candidatus Daviesbacteria bacterium]